MINRELTEDQLVHEEFMRRFSAWDIPVEQLQLGLDAMPNEQRQQHYMEVRDILAKPAFKRELADWVRRVSRALAMGVSHGQPLTELQQQSLRIMMLEIQHFQDMLEKRAALLAAPQPLRKRTDKL